jgi:hypothetical protein
MVSDLAAGLPLGQPDESSDKQINDLKRSLPSEIARISNKIAKLEKELA